MRIPLFLAIFFMLISPVSLRAQTSKVRQDFMEYQFPRYEHCSMHILPGAENMFLDLEAALSRAKHYVHIEYYKWYNDSIGRHLLDVLAECASRGVKVRLMYDAFGNSGKAPNATPEFVDGYRAKGIQIVGFDPMRFPYVNHALHRLHRKMVIIDGKMVYTGGMNVADYYIHGKPEMDG